MSSLLGLERYQHLRAASLYEQLKVCKNCFLALTKIEFMRRRQITKGEKGVLPVGDEEDGYEEIEDEDSLELKYLPNRTFKRKKKRFEVIGEGTDNYQLMVKNKSLKYL